MHNGCLLLLAFVTVFQPIASYTERRLVDGRLQRCEYRTSVRDLGLNFHGTYRFNKPTVENHPLNHRDIIRDVRRYEVREENLRIPSYSERRLADDTLERDRNTLTILSRDRVERRENREGRLVSIERNQEIRRDRFSRGQEDHQTRFAIRLSDDENRSQRKGNRRLNERVSLEFREDTCGNGLGEETQRVREQQEINQARYSGASNLNERRIVRESVQSMDTRRSVSRMDRTLDGESSDRRFSRDLRSSSNSGNRINRAHEDTKSLDRNDRRASSLQRFVNEQRQRDSRIRLAVERRNIRDFGSRRVRDDRTFEHRRDAPRFQRAQYEDRENRYTENKARLVRAVRSVDNGVSRNERSDSRIFTREAENRRALTNTRNIMNTRSLERNTKYRMDSRSLARLVENRKDNRFIERESQQHVITDRLAQTLDYERRLSTEERMPRLITRKRSQENRQISSRAFRTGRAGEDRRVVRDVSARAIRTEHFNEDRRDARNVGIPAFRIENSGGSARNSNERQQDASSVGVRSFRIERSDKRQRVTRNTEVGKYRIVGSDQTRRADARNNRFRSFRTELSEESGRDARIVGARTFDTERSDENRREIRSLSTERNAQNARNVDVRALRTERTDKSRGDTRNIKGRLFRTERTDESATLRRETRLVERQSRSLDRVTDSRRNVRTLESRTEDERTNNRRAGRSLERDIQWERTIENRLNEKTIRNTVGRRREDRRNRSIENLRTAQAVHKDIRSLDAHERRVESTRINLIRSENDQRYRKTDRTIERLNKRESIDSRRTYNQRESRKAIDTQRTSDRDNLARRHVASSRVGFDAEFAKKRESQTIFRNPTHTGNVPTIMNWQYVLYTLQGIYICGLLMQLNKGSAEKKTGLAWLPVPQRLIKVE